MKLAVFLAYKSIIRGNRWAMALIIVVMSLSFANLILTPSIMSGVTETLDSQQVDTLLANIIIDPLPAEYYLDGAGATARRVEQIPGVTGVSPHLNSAALIEHEWQTKDSPEDKETRPKSYKIRATFG